MGRHSIITLRVNGIECRSDAGLIDPSDDNSLCLLSLYGTPQQTKGLFASLASYKQILAIRPDDTTLYISRSHEPLCFKGASIGYGKQHAIIFSELSNAEALAFWFNESDRLKKLDGLLSTGKIPYDREWLPKLEHLLLENEYLVRLHGWGGIEGFKMAMGTYEDQICDMIVENIGHLEPAIRQEEVPCAA